MYQRTQAKSGISSCSIIRFHFCEYVLVTFLLTAAMLGFAEITLPPGKGLANVSVGVVAPLSTFSDNRNGVFVSEICRFPI